MDSDLEVKLFLFQSYCSNFYCLHLWYNFTKVQMNKLRITYNNAMKHLINLQFRCSASKMFANCNIHSLDEIRRKCICWAQSVDLADPWIYGSLLRAGIHGSRKVVACAICGFCVFCKTLHYSNPSLVQTYIYGPIDNLY